MLYGILKASLRQQTSIYVASLLDDGKGGGNGDAYTSSFSKTIMKIFKKKP
jgi:hypothetical protein